MAHAAVNWVINEAAYSDAVKPAARWLLVQIADRADKDEWSCWPSHKTLAKDAGMSSRSVLSLLSLLEAEGLIRRTERFRPNNTRTTDMITVLRTADIAVPEKGATPAPQVLHDGGEKVAAQNLVIEPGKGTVVVGDARTPFEVWWARYPLKKAKDAAIVAFSKAMRRIDGPDPLQVLLDGLDRYIEEIARTGVLIKHPATWLNQGCWADEPDTHRSQTDGQPTHTDRGEQRAASRLQAMDTGARQAVTGGRRRWGS